MRKSSFDIGETFTTNEGCCAEVIEYRDSGKIKIRFLDKVGYEKYVTATNIRNKEIKNPFHPSVHGVGFFGVGPFVAKVDNKNTYEYNKWRGMMTRSYDPRTKSNQPAYQACSVVESWHNYQTFAGWLVEQKGYGNIGWDLDKDLLIHGNKEYGPNACILVPTEINNLLTGGNSNNGLPRGVCWHKNMGKYIAQCRSKGVIHHLGYYVDIEDAQKAYKTFKKEILKSVAMEYYGQIDERLFKMLLDYPEHAF